MSITHKQNLKKILFAMRYRIGILIAFFVLSLGSVILMQNVLLEKAHISGKEMARSYTVEEEKSFRAYTVALRLASQDLEKIILRRNNEIISHNVQDVLRNLKNTFTTSKIVPYAIINGQPFFLNEDYYERVENINLRKTPWYEQAMEADGEVIYTDAYHSSINNDLVITAAKETSIPGTIIAFDIFPSKFGDITNASILPPRSYYYLFDSAGHLLYTTSNVLTDEQMEEYVHTLNQNIVNGTILADSINVTRPDGQERTAYYVVSSNGWISIVTMPYHYLLKEIYTIGGGAVAILAIFIIISIFTTIHEVRLNQNITRTTDTIRVLGNSYYAIYRMNFRSNTYEMIKDSDEVRKKLSPKGSYDSYLAIMSETIEDSAKEEFIENFSAQNIKKLVSQRVRDYGGDFKRKFSNGEYQWVSVRLLFDESLDSDEAVLCYRKIEEEKQLQLQQLDLLRSSLESAQQSEKARNMFFSSMSHDMRTPLNAIIGLAELAKNFTSNPTKIEDYLNKITVSSKHLLDLINDILEISRLEQGKMNVESKQINLKDCVEESATLFQSRAAQEGKAFMINFDIKDSLVYGDPFRLSQILNNLISNAFKFTNANDRITVRLKQLGNDKHVKYQFEIEDTGAGMSKEFLDRIFLPYERETRFGAKNVNGTGLGTAIVKNIISHLGGEIKVASELGKGTTFTVILPFEPVKIEEQAKEQHEDETACQGNCNSLAGKRILLAEDNAINMEIATELLSMNEVEVVQAWDGLEAVEKFKSAEENYFDAILMDMQMPNMDGCEAAKAIRSLSRADAKSVPIIAVTANAFAEDFAATSAAGMNAHISKPIDFAILCQTISDYVTK